MSGVNSLLSKLESYLSCVKCHRKLVHPKIISSCQHSICRICLDQLISLSSSLSLARCPECQEEIVDSNIIPIIRENQEADRLLQCYYNINRLSKEYPQSEVENIFQRTESVQSDNTVETVENVPTSPFTLQPLVSDSSPCNSQPMSSSRNMRNSAAQHADLVDELVNESGSETDLDLPDPSTFLSTSSPTHQAPDATVTFVPETPPSLVSNSKEDIQQDTTPKSTQQRVTATYSAKNSPRASVSSWRSLNANLNMRQEQEDVNGSPTRKRRREALLVGASSLTAVNGSSTIDNVKSIVIAKDTKSLQPTTPRRGRKRTSEAVRTVEKDTNVLQTSQRKRPTRNEDVGAAVKSKPAGTTGAELRLLTTGLSDAQLGRLRRAAKQMMEQQIAATVDIHNSTELLGIPAQKGGYTHLIAAVGKDGRASRTFKYLAALASGAWLVTVDWLLESVKAQNLLPEAEFAVKGDCALPNYSLSGPRSIHELLCKYQIHLWPSSGWDSSAHSQAELQRLIHATGAKVIDALPASENLSTAENYVPTSILPHDNSGVSGARKTTNNGVGGSMEREIKAVPAKYRWLFELPVREDVPVVLVDTSSLKGARSNIALGAIVSTTGGTIPCRTKSWLFDCISANTTL